MQPNDKDVRWHQRLESYGNAFLQLRSALELQKQRPLSQIESQGMIKAFEFTHELAWNLMKDFFEFQGHTSIMGSRDAVRESFSLGLIKDGDAWMEMIKSRNQTSHTYNESVAQKICKQITSVYYLQFENFLTTMKQRKTKDDG